MQAVREGVRAVAHVVDGEDHYDPARYYMGKIAIEGTLSQDIEVPRGSLLHELLVEGPAAAGAEIDELIRRCKAKDISVELEMRKLLLPDAMMASGSSCSDEPETGPAKS